MKITAEYLAVFTEEAREHLELWETSLLALEQNPDSTEELVNDMFRSIHTLKGSAGFIGFELLQKVAHDLESSLQTVRDGAAPLDATRLDTLFRGMDLCKKMVEDFSAGRPSDHDAESFLSGLGAGETPPASPPPSPLASPPEAESASGSSPQGPRAGASSLERSFRVGILIEAPAREAFLRAFLVRNRLAAMSTILGEEPPPEVLRNAGGRFAYTVILATLKDEKAIREALDIDQVEVTAISQTEAKEQDKSGESGQSPRGAPAQTSARQDEVVRVSVDRLDDLLNLVGELVIQNSAFVSLADRLDAEQGRSPFALQLQEKTENLSKITRDLQDGIMRVRMLPVKNVFRRFHRVARDLARDRGKEIALEVFGEETEIDKKVMDRIADPLVHLVRNAVDHGIEGHDQRVAAGKRPAGLVRLGAYQEGDHICVEVSDDGRGIDREAVLRKGIEKGLIPAEHANGLPDERILGLIFLPGFSTAPKITEVSGRGVGMDVVKKAVDDLGGSIRVRSVGGRGTTVTISLPLTMAIIPAVLVEVSGATIAVPLSSVQEVLKVKSEEVKSVGGQRVIRLREDVLSLVSLKDALALAGNGGEDGHGTVPVVVVDFEGRKVGLEVARVAGNRDIVIKSLSRHYREVEDLIGASILGDGRIALIVDVESLVKRYCGARIGGSVGGSPKGPQAIHVVAQAQAAGSATRSSEETGRSTPKPAGDAAASPQPRQPHLVSAAIEDVHNAGAIQASVAISQMTGREIRVSFPESQLFALGEVAEVLGGEEAAVCGIYVGVGGEIPGGILMVLPQENIPRFNDLMLRRPEGSCLSPAEADLSAISELGNILSASFINSMSDQTGVLMKSASPEISMDMCLPVIDSVLSRFSQPGGEILLTKAVLYLDDSEQVVCHLLLFLEPRGLSTLVERLGRARPE